MLPFRSVKNFYPRPPRGGRPPAVARGYPSAKISIHALREEGDVGGDPALGLFGISIHALREEGDLSPYGAAHEHQDFYPRPPRGGRRCRRRRRRPHSSISIHALREEGDLSPYGAAHEHQDFYPRPPRGGRLSPSCVYALHWKFLSTPSARRATKAIDDYTMQLIISIHALREEGDRRRPHQRPAGGISIHALREEGDPIVFRLYLKLEVFLSTPSARRATRSAATRRRRCSNFYPRPPRGGRLVCAKNKTPAFVFLSTPSARRATPQRR